MKIHRHYLWLSAASLLLAVTCAAPAVAEEAPSAAAPSTGAAVGSAPVAPPQQPGAAADPAGKSVPHEERSGAPGEGDCPYRRMTRDKSVTS